MDHRSLRLWMEDRFDSELLALDMPRQGFKELGHSTVEEGKHHEDQKDFEGFLVAHELKGLSQRRFIQGGLRRVFLFRSDLQSL